MRLKVTTEHWPDGATHTGYWMWCPGCDHPHRIGDSWGWDGNRDAPTFTPSILVYSHKTLDANDNVVDTPRCHSFVRSGVWEFLSDSTHALAGQKVPMVDLPDWLANEGVTE